MSIAQRFVAGEGNTHLASGESGIASVISAPAEDRDAAALTAFATDATNLPWLIFRAAFRATHIDALPARARALLSALARTVDAARPYGAIFARRELLHNRSLLSRRTLYRALGDLETAGLIRRAGQLRITSEGYEGQFGRTYLHLTEHAATLLGLVEAHVHRSVPSEQRDEDSTAHVPAFGSFEQPDATVAPGANNKDLLPGPFQKRQPGQLPADLERLRTLGFSKFLIFGLMRDARQNGKRLSDVVEATWTHLNRATRPICYLRSLLSLPVDFAWQIRTRQTEAAAQHDARAERDAALLFARQHAGETWIDESGKRRIDIDPDGQGATVRLAHEGTARREAGDWALRLLRATRAGSLRVAGEDDLESFASLQRTTCVHGAVEAPAPRIMTATVAGHLAGLRDLIRGHGRAGRTVAEAGA